MNLELTDKFKNRPDSPFNYYFKTGLNDTHYFVFSSITYDEYQPAGNRVTFLKKTTFLDTVDGRPNYSLRDPNIFSNNDYYFYILTSTQRRNLGEKGSETHGITINLDKDPRRFSVQRTEDGKKHFVVIEKDDNATSVRLNSGKSRFDALGAEKVIQTKFGWNRNQKSIKKRLIKYQTNDNGEIIPDRYQEATLHDIMASSEYTNIFDIENPDETLS
ncbi:MAG: hypothetical protein KDH96_12090, partial [Candidatus Riesia sp.]|nr:hypothetical protein [Candidatus Riesia sp.]